MQKGLIGVIVPVYKAEKYIAECIESILAQTYTKFRLILVDDGTPDNAGKICDEYAKKDSRITVIHQDNAGVTRARARGVEECCDCEFITFVDADDTIVTQAFHTIHSYSRDNIDIVLAVFNKEHTPAQDIISNVEYRHWAVENIYFVGAPWSKLVRRSLFNDFVFDIPTWIKVHEDTIMNIRLAFNANNSIAICKKPIYNYRPNENGTMQTYRKDIKYEENLHEYIKASIPNEEYNIYIRDTIPYRLMQWRKFYKYQYRVNGMKSEKFYSELLKDIKRYKFKLALYEKILFYFYNPFIRYITIKTEFFSHKLLRALSKRQ